MNNPVFTLKDKENIGKKHLRHSKNDLLPVTLFNESRELLEERKNLLRLEKEGKSS